MKNVFSCIVSSGTVLCYFHEKSISEALMEKCLNGRGIQTILRFGVYSTWDNNQGKEPNSLVVGLRHLERNIF